MCPVRSGCPWSIAANGLVYCDAMSGANPGPVVAKGDGDDPPLVLKACRVQAAVPYRTASGAIIEAVEATS